MWGWGWGWGWGGSGEVEVGEGECGWRSEGGEVGEWWIIINM